MKSCPASLRDVAYTDSSEQGYHCGNVYRGKRHADTRFNSGIVQCEQPHGHAQRERENKNLTIVRLAIQHSKTPCEWYTVGKFGIKTASPFLNFFMAHRRVEDLRPPCSSSKDWFAENDPLSFSCFVIIPLRVERDPHTGGIFLFVSHLLSHLSSMLIERRVTCIMRYSSSHVHNCSVPFISCSDHK